MFLVCTMLHFILIQPNWFLEDYFYYTAKEKTMNEWRNIFEHYKTDKTLSSIHALKIIAKESTIKSKAYFHSSFLVEHITLH